MPHIIYAVIEYLIKKVDGCANNPENSSATKIGGHIPLCRKYCMKKFCSSLREHYENVIDFEKKNMLPLTK